MRKLKITTSSLIIFAFLSWLLIAFIADYKNIENKNIVKEKPLKERIVGYKISEKPKKLFGGESTTTEEKLIDEEPVVLYKFIPTEKLTTSTYAIKTEKDEEILDENVKMRTSNARFYNKSNGEVVATFYNGTQFVKENEDWYEIKSATTTLTEFNKIIEEDWSLINKVGAAQSTTTEETVDAYINTAAGSATWATERGRASGVNVVNSTIIEFEGDLQGGTYYIVRGFCAFDTSALTSAATISSARYLFTVTGQSGSPVMNLSSTTWSGASLPTTSDFGNVDLNTPATRWGTDLTLSSTGAKIFTFNNDGINGISKTGKTTFAVRNNKDIDNTAPVTSAALYTDYSSSNNATNKPVLEITYSTSTPATSTATQLKGGIIIFE